MTRDGSGKLKGRRGRQTSRWLRERRRFLTAQRQERGWPAAQRYGRAHPMFYDAAWRGYIVHIQESMFQTAQPQDASKW